MNSDYKYTSVGHLRDKAKNVLDGTRFLGDRYIVTRNGDPIAQVVPPTTDDNIERITITKFRYNTREILNDVRYDHKAFLLLRHGRADGLLCPLWE